MFTTVTTVPPGPFCMILTAPSRGWDSREVNGHSHRMFCFIIQGNLKLSGHDSIMTLTATRPGRGAPPYPAPD